MTNELNNHDEIKAFKKAFKYKESVSPYGTKEVKFFSELKNGNGIQLGFWYHENYTWWVVCEESTNDEFGDKSSDQIKHYFEVQLKNLIK